MIEYEWEYVEKSDALDVDGDVFNIDLEEVEELSFEYNQHENIYSTSN